MSTSSFKQNQGSRPFDYRTPSPPVSAIEPLSPLLAGCLPTENGGIRIPSKRTFHHNITNRSHILPSNSDLTKRDGAGDRQGAMDAFASIALSTSSDVTPRRSSHQEEAGSRSGMVFALPKDPSDRPAKRARSEKLPSPQSRRAGVGSRTRPSTSYGDNRMLEAELLLNFAQEARFSVPPPLNRRDRVYPISPTPIAPSTIPRNPQLRQVEPKEERNRNSMDRLGTHYETGEDDQKLTKLSEHFSHNPWHSSHGSLYEAMKQDSSLIAEQEASRVLERPAATVHIAGKATQETGNCYIDDYSPSQHTHMQQATETTKDEDGSNERRTSEMGRVHSPITPQVTYHSSEHVESQNRLFDISSSAGMSLLLEDASVHTGVSVPSVHLNATTNATRPELESDLVETDPDINAESSGIATQAVCAGCGFTRNIVNGELENSLTSWISCDACKSWFHFACAGFKNEREVRSVDKYRCRKCKPTHGATTYVRKSSRAHSSIDYAGLHQGVIKTSDDTPEHHYIQPIKDGTISFTPETFPRMLPELLTAEYFEQCRGWREPIVIPAVLNPQPQGSFTTCKPAAPGSEEKISNGIQPESSAPEEWALDGSESQYAPDHGQDGLDMIMPQGLTVRTVAELYGPEEKVEVIDVKSQNGEGKKWNMRRWAEYYESKGNKIVRNVISLEVSQSKLGRLIKRPQIVRDLDLQDSVWPAELQAKGEIPRVQLYCLMSVADCFTDFHIDFGGSSVFYHILKGKKTFFFIPPKEKHLKKYEEWCLSPAQNWTFLGGQTKECYRVDLSEGDTMLIPAGWIHAVWTPEDSLVIGGNFLTRLNYGMQLRIAQIEKATGVARKFRYPHFQKIHWYTAFRYLKEDPLPSTVKDLLQAGSTFERETPSYFDFNAWGENSRPGQENYHARYYSQAELEGLPDLIRYLLRTAMIDMGSITDGITAETRNAVKRSIPRGHGEPLDVVKDLAAWCAWKRGNETIPSWAYPDAMLEPETTGKISLVAQKKLDREAALQAPRRQSARMLQQSTQSKAPDSSHSGEVAGSEISLKRSSPDYNHGDTTDTQIVNSVKRRRTTSGTGSGSHRKVACESCRKRRRACKHKDVSTVTRSDSQAPSADIDIGSSMLPTPNSTPANVLRNSNQSAESIHDPIDSVESEILARIDPNITMQQLMDLSPEAAALTDADREKLDLEMKYLLKHPGEIASTPKMLTHLSGAGLLRLEHRIAGGPVNGLSVLSLNAPHSRGRTKACNDCRKSKRRCIHDEHGNEDPVKAREATMPRPAATHKRRKLDNEGSEIPSAKKLRKSAVSIGFNREQQVSDDAAIDPQTVQRAPVANMVPASPAGGMQETEQKGMFSAFDQMQAAAVAAEVDLGYAVDTRNSQVGSDEKGQRSDNKPAPATQSHTATTIESAPDTPPAVSASRSSGTTPPDTKEEIPPDPAYDAPSQPAASLVSPPASEHQDAIDTTPPRTTILLGHPYQQAEQQRYTPEYRSRRASSSSANGPAEASESGRASSGPTMAPKEVSPITTISTTGEEERKEIGPGSIEKRKSRGSLESIADEESLRLIKELQAEDYGLRKRGRA